jgi:hypothetical protein
MPNQEEALLCGSVVVGWMLVINPLEITKIKNAVDMFDFVRRAGVTIQVLKYVPSAFQALLHAGWFGSQLAAMVLFVRWLFYHAVSFLEPVLVSHHQTNLPVRVPPPRAAAAHTHDLRCRDARLQGKARRSRGSAKRSYGA